MPRFHTVVPLQNIDLPANTRIQFGGGILLEAIPAWLQERPQPLLRQVLTENDLQQLRGMRWAFTAEYDADAFGSPDPQWRGPEPRSIQDTKAEQCTWGNLALWLSEPSPVCTLVEIHAPDFGDGVPVIQNAARRNSRLLCHPHDVDRRVREQHAAVAAEIHAAMVDLGRVSDLVEKC